MIITLPFPIPIAQEARQYMSLECVFFVIVKMACGMLRVRWSDIVLMARVSTEGKTGN